MTILFLTDSSTGPSWHLWLWVFFLFLNKDLIHLVKYVSLKSLVLMEAERKEEVCMWFHWSSQLLLLFLHTNHTNTWALKTSTLCFEIIQCLNIRIYISNWKIPCFVLSPVKVQRKLPNDNCPFAARLPADVCRALASSCVINASLCFSTRSISFCSSASFASWCRSCAALRLEATISLSTGAELLWFRDPSAALTADRRPQTQDVRQRNALF